MTTNTYYYPLKDGCDVGETTLLDGIYHEIIEIDQVNQTMTTIPVYLLRRFRIWEE
jgi:hypothetical protein